MKLSRIRGVKFFIFGVDVILLVIGFAMLALGVWLKTDTRFKDYLSQQFRQEVATSQWDAPTLYIFSYMIIVLGAFMVVTAFFGCCGSIAENRCLLTAYAIFLMILFCSTVGMGTYILYKRDAIENELSDSLTYMVQHYYQGTGIVQETMDHLQNAFRCCGNAGCVDYEELRLDRPRSCINCDGCQYRMTNAIRIGFTITTVVFVVVLVAELLAIILSILLCCAFNDVARERRFKKFQHQEVEAKRPVLPMDDQNAVKYRPLTRYVGPTAADGPPPIRPPPPAPPSYSTQPKGYRESYQQAVQYKSSV